MGKISYLAFIRKKNYKKVLSRNLPFLHINTESHMENVCIHGESETQKSISHSISYVKEQRNLHNYLFPFSHLVLQAHQELHSSPEETHPARPHQ